MLAYHRNMKHTKHEQPDQPKPTPAPNSAPSNARRSPPEINADNSVKISTNSTPSHKQVGGFAAGNPWRFQRGRSGNPKGRPRQPGPKLLSDILRQGLTQPFPQDHEKSYAEVIASLILNSAGGGDLKAIAELLDRTEGRAPQSVGVRVLSPLESEEWARLRDTIWEALQPFPDAQAAVLQAIDAQEQNADSAS